MIGIVDYGMGNIGSIVNMIKKLGVTDIALANTPEQIELSDQLILPGVGAFDSGMKLLEESGLRKALDRKVLDKNTPILGICLGMQMMGLKSEEGSMDGLGYVQMNCRKFRFQNTKRKVPHMGWDYVSVLDDHCSFTSDMEEPSRFYFVHSFYAECHNEEDVLMTCDYGLKFTAAIHHFNIYGVQFHPEKSHRFGMKLMSNFAGRCN